MYGIYLLTTTKKTKERRKEKTAYETDQADEADHSLSINTRTEDPNPLEVKEEMQGDVGDDKGVTSNILF